MTKRGGAMPAIIRRPIGGRRYKYNKTQEGNRVWGDSPLQAYPFADRETAEKHLKAHKIDYGIEDEVAEFPATLDSTTCIFCTTRAARHVGTERVTSSHVILDIVCSHCNQKWQEKYAWKNVIVG